MSLKNQQRNNNNSPAPPKNSKYNVIKFSSIPPPGLSRVKGLTCDFTPGRLHPHSVVLMSVMRQYTSFQVDASMLPASDRGVHMLTFRLKTDPAALGQKRARIQSRLWSTPLLRFINVASWYAGQGPRAAFDFGEDWYYVAGPLFWPWFFFSFLWGKARLRASIRLRS